jgi:predicted DCC family thiol-disulfide oxidoreductase YuxK
MFSEIEDRSVISPRSVSGGRSESIDPGGLVLLYDGLCPVCDGSVRYVLAHDRRGTMRLASLQSEFAAAVLARHPELAAIDSIVLVENAPGGEQVWVQSEAVLRIASYLGGPYRAARLLRILPRFLRDAVYALVARFRYRWFGRYDACPLPPPEVRARFLG